MLRQALRQLRTLGSDESGATAVEYGLILAAIAGVIVAIVFVIGKKAKNSYNNMAAAFP